MAAHLGEIFHLFWELVEHECMLLHSIRGGMFPHHVASECGGYCFGSTWFGSVYEALADGVKWLHNRDVV